MEYIHAIDNNDIEYVKHLINNTDVNIDSAPYPTENTPLNYATIYNNLDIVKLLVKAGANLEIVNEDGETPLYNAALHGNIEIVKFLIDSGAPPLESPSNLVSIAPEIPTFSWNDFVKLAASCPIIESTTNKTSSGLLISFIRTISFIIKSSICNLPAVSMIMVSKSFSFA